MEALPDNHLQPAKSLSNFTSEDEKYVLLQETLRYCHESNTIVLHVPSALTSAYFQFCSISFKKVGLFEHVIYS